MLGSSSSSLKSFAKFISSLISYVPVGLYSEIFSDCIDYLMNLATRTYSSRFKS